MKNKTWLWVAGIALVFFFLVVVAVAVSVRLAMLAAKGDLVEGNIALVHIEGVITSGGSSPNFLSGGSPGSEGIVKILDRVESNPGLKAIVLRVNSPGGTAAGSQEIYEKLVDIRNKTGKKIVVSMGDVDASGAYYISSAADKIFAEPATLTGSIGVIAELMDLQSLFKKIGVHPETMKAGKLKDMGSQSRPLTFEERNILQSILDETHNEFIADVAKGRNLPVEQVRKLADGRIYTGRQALNLHLLDTLGNLEDAENEAAKLANITGKPRIVNVDRKTFFDQIMGDSSAGTSARHLVLQLLSGENGFSCPEIFFLATGIPVVH